MDDDEGLGAVVRSARPRPTIATTSPSPAGPPLPTLSSSPTPEPLLTSSAPPQPLLRKGCLPTDLLSPILRPSTAHHSIPFPSPTSNAAGLPLIGRAPFSPQESDEGHCSTPEYRGSRPQIFKRRKMEEKRVVCIPAAPGAGKTGGCIPSDLWAWRKYGQKPIKGSPHPRGYYRCSSWKGCSARKQVERSVQDPSMLVITYTSDHNHPWFGHPHVSATEGCASSAQAYGGLQHQGSTSSPHHKPHHEKGPSQLRGGDDATPPPPGKERAACNAAATATSHAHSDELLLLLSPLEELLYPFGALSSRMNNTDYKSDEEEDENASTVDPYNLFNFSSTFHRH